MTLPIILIVIILVRLSPDSLALKYMVIFSGSVLVSDVIFHMITIFSPYRDHFPECGLQWTSLCTFYYNSDWFLFVSGIVLFWTINRLSQMVLSTNPKAYTSLLQQ